MSDPTFREYHDQFEAAALRGGGSVRRLANGGCLVRFGPLDAPRLAVLSGVHGDERGGPLALLHGLAHPGPGEDLPPNCSLWLAPLLNDAGWDANTREWHGLNLNSAFLPGVAPPFVAEVMADLAAQVPRVFLDLHEDSEKPFPYLYRFTADAHDFTPRLQQILGAGDVPWSPADGERWRGSTETYVRGLGCERCATLEAPPVWPLERRIEWNLRAVSWCLREWEHLAGPA